MSQVNDEQMQEFFEVFCLFDLKGDGKIAANQLGDCLRALNQNPTEEEIRKCGYTDSPDSRISFEVFLPILTTISRTREQHTAEDFQEGFKMFDKEQNGYITSAELRHILTCLGDKLSDEDCDQLFQNQEDNQGNINYEDFVRSIMNG